MKLGILLIVDSEAKISVNLQIRLHAIYSDQRKHFSKTAYLPIISDTIISGSVHHASKLYFIV